MKKLFIVLGISFWSTLAWGLGLDEARQKGILGETESGYLEIVGESANKEAVALMNQINQGRRQEYSKIAARNGTPVAVVESVAGKKAIEKAAPGQFVKSANGKWSVK